MCISSSANPRWLAKTAARKPAAPGGQKAGVEREARLEGKVFMLLVLISISLVVTCIAIAAVTITITINVNVNIIKPKI